MSTFASEIKPTTVCPLTASNSWCLGVVVIAQRRKPNLRAETRAMDELVRQGEL